MNKKRTWSRCPNPFRDRSLMPFCCQWQYRAIVGLCSTRSVDRPGAAASFDGSCCNRLISVYRLHRVRADGCDDPCSIYVLVTVPFHYSFIPQKIKILCSASQSGQIRIIFRIKLHEFLELDPSGNSCNLMRKPNYSLEFWTYT